MSRIIVPSEDVADHRVAAAELVRGAGLVELTGSLAPGSYGPSREVLDVLDAVERGLACVVAARRAIVGRIVADRRSGFAGGELTCEEQTFCSLLAVYIGAKEALAALALEPRQLPPSDRALSLAEYRDLLTAADDSLARGLAADLAGYVGFYRDHRDANLRPEGGEKLRACVGSYLALVAATAARIGDDGDYVATRDALKEAGLTIAGATYRGFARETALPVEESRGLMPVRPADIVGNEAVLEAGMALARAVAGYDLERDDNPMQIRNPVLFVLGAPGCGKTVTAHAVGNYFLDLCRDHDIPARFRIIRRTDWASHFQNKSANELLRIFQEEIFDFPGVAGVYWPDIDTAFAARSEPGIRAEEKAVLGTLFGLLDGTVGPRNGKWFLISDANYLAMDDAALSRLTQDPHYAKGPQSPADFVDLLRDKKLSGVGAHLLLSDEEWAAFGQRCVDAKLSGRAVDNLAGKILAEMENVELPDSYFSLAFQDKVELLDERRKDFSHADIDALIDRYIEFERDAEQRADKERFDRRVQEIREQLAARVAAVTGDLE